MKKFFCHKCKSEIPSLFSACQNCGYKYSVKTEVELLDGTKIAIHKKKYLIAYLLATGMRPKDVVEATHISMEAYRKLMNRAGSPPQFPEVVLALKREFINHLPEMVLYEVVPEKFRDALESNDDNRIINWCKYILDLYKKGFLGKKKKVKPVKTDSYDPKVLRQLLEENENRREN